MENWTQLGVAGATLAILAFIVKYFVDAQKEDRKNSREMTERFIRVAERSTEVQRKNTQAIDKLTEMIFKVLQNK